MVTGYACKKSGVSQGMISLIERGVNAPTTETLVPIANALGIPIASIMGEPAPAPTPPQMKPTSSTIALTTKTRKRLWNICGLF